MRYSQVHICYAYACIRYANVMYILSHTLFILYSYVTHTLAYATQPMIKALLTDCRRQLVFKHSKVVPNFSYVIHAFYHTVKCDCTQAWTCTTRNMLALFLFVLLSILVEVPFMLFKQQFNHLILYIPHHSFSISINICTDKRVYYK